MRGNYFFLSMRPMVPLACSKPYRHFLIMRGNVVPWGFKLEILSNRVKILCFFSFISEFMHYWSFFVISFDAKEHIGFDSRRVHCVTFCHFFFWIIYVALSLVCKAAEDLCITQSTVFIFYFIEETQPTASVCTVEITEHASWAFSATFIKEPFLGIRKCQHGEGFFFPRTTFDNKRCS